MKLVQVLLTNRIAYIDTDSSKVKKRLRKALRFRPPSYQYSPAYKYRGWDGYVHLYDEGDSSCPAGLFRAIQDKLSVDIKVKFQVEKDLLPVFFRRTGLTSKENKWKFQNDCVQKMILNAEQGGGLVLNATGSGKTRIAGMLFSWMDGNAVFVVDELTLLKQSRKALAATLGEKVGIVGESKFRPRRITVATVQTLHKYRNNKDFRQWTRTLEVVMIDEVHLAMNKRNFQTVAAIKPPCVFGLTATLAIRKKHVRMKAFSLCGPVLFEYPLKQGQAEGILDHGVVIQVPHKHLAYKRRGKHGYRKDYEKLIVDCDKRNDIVQSLVEEGIKRKKHVVVLVERVSHVMDFHDRFKKIPHKLAFGAISASDRFKAATDMNKEKVNLVIANKVFNKGIDISRLDVIIDAAGMKSAENAIQKFGRGVRKHKNKKGMIYFDIRDVENRFEEAAKKRKSAFRRVHVPVIQIEEQQLLNKHWVKTAYEIAESKLKEIKNK